MRRLALELLGGFSVRLGDRPLALPRKKAQALLAYLALPAGRFHTREKLTALLWGDRPETYARHSFRQALSSLRAPFSNEDPPILLTRGAEMALNPAAVTVDVTTFEAELSDGGVEALARATALYRGELLDGFGVDETPFERWRALERERLHELALEGLTHLLSQQLSAEATEPAIQTALRILALDPVQESVHRALMRLFVRQGRRAAALRQYQDCVGWLQRELGAEPEEETRTFYRDLLRSTGDDRIATPRGGIEGRSLLRDRRGHHPADSPMVGRGPEIEALRQALERTLDGGVHVALINGEAGVGKTRLVQELSAEAEARGLLVLFSRCHETERPLPFRPWVDALRAEQAALDSALANQVSAVSRASLARVFPELTTPSGVPEVPEAESIEHGLLFEALRELVGIVAREGPVLIVLEDLHWTDSMSARLLSFLGRRLGALPVLIVGSARPEDAVDAPVLTQALAELRAEGPLEEIALGPLSRDDSLALARALRREADARLVDQIADDLWALSEGNPFVIVETVRALGQSVTIGGPRALIAQSVYDSVARRLAHLSDPARRVVDTAAVIGRCFPFRLLAETSGLAELDAATAVEEVVRRRVLDVVGEELDLCHDRIRQVAYERLLPARRLVLHRAAAQSLESLNEGRLDEVADELGHHFLQAGEIEKALIYLKRFAEIATRRCALDEALGALCRAAESVERLPEPSRKRHRLDLALCQAFVLTAGGRHRECRDVLHASVPLQRRVADPRLSSEYHYRLAMTTFYLGDYAEARLAGEAALRAGEWTEDNEHIGRAFYTLALVSTAAGQAHEAAEYCARAVAALDGLSTRRLAAVHWLLALNRIYAGQFDGAMEQVNRCVALADTVGDSKLRSMAGGLESWVHTARGEGRAAIECAQRALETSQGTIPTSLALRWVGYAHLHEGEAEPAIRVLEQACKQIEHFPVRHTYVESLAFLAEAYVLGHDAARGMETASRAIDLARAEGSPFNVGLAERAAARAAWAMDDHEASEAHLSRALEAFLSNGAAFEVGMTRLDLARALASRGETAGARTDLAGAIEIFVAAGAPRRVAQAVELARSLGIALPESSP